MVSKVMLGERQSQNHNVNEVAKEHAGGNRLDPEMAVAEDDHDDGQDVAYQLPGRGDDVAVLGVEHRLQNCGESLTNDKRKDNSAQPHCSSNRLRFQSWNLGRYDYRGESHPQKTNSYQGTKGSREEVSQ